MGKMKNKKTHGARLFLKEMVHRPLEGCREEKNMLERYGKLSLLGYKPQEVLNKRSRYELDIFFPLRKLIVSMKIGIVFVFKIVLIYLDIIICNTINFIISKWIILKWTISKRIISKWIILKWTISKRIILKWTISKGAISIISTGLLLLRNNIIYDAKNDIYLDFKVKLCPNSNYQINKLIKSYVYLADRSLFKVNLKILSMIYYLFIFKKINNNKDMEYLKKKKNLHTNLLTDEEAERMWKNEVVFRPTRFVLLKIINIRKMPLKNIINMIERKCKLDRREFGGIAFIERANCYTIFVNERCLFNKEVRPGLISVGKFDRWLLSEVKNCEKEIKSIAEMMLSIQNYYNKPLKIACQILLKCFKDQDY